MFIKKEKRSLFDLRPDEYVKFSNSYEPIINVVVQDGIATLTLPNDLELKIIEDDLDLWEFLKLEDYSDGVISTLTHSCRHCNRPVGYDTIEGIEGHLDRCLFNEKNEMCLMCKYLTIYEEAPYPKNHQMRTPDVEWAFGNYRKPYCEKYDKYLDEEDLMNKQPDCFQLSLDEIRIKHTKDYETWLELSTEHYDSLEKEVEDNEN
jgi:hypothetical protein